MTLSRCTLERQDRRDIIRGLEKQAEHLEKHVEEVKEIAKMVSDRLKDYRKRWKKLKARKGDACNKARLRKGQTGGGMQRQMEEVGRVWREMEEEAEKSQTRGGKTTERD